ncbi:TetR/AcrR family transcriptional regulator [Micromonospora sp. NPDC000316]|uniref:TetR/AcrR family transcriptional regulator n=1 Tax=Micromonospora sp. NPDC000316 TaxID=3364216 RepID=UPI0036A8A8CC
MDEITGLRERKKAATRLALHEAALRLAAEHGPDGVTVEAIADAANVSRRTFSNYFSNKEEALFHGDTVRLRRLLQLVHERPVDEPPWTALSRAAERFTPEAFGGRDRFWLPRRRQLRGNPGLAAQQVAAYTAIERELATALVPRLTGADVALRARLLAATFMAILRVAIQHWIDHPDDQLLDTVRAALAEVAPPSAAPDHTNAAAH